MDHPSDQFPTDPAGLPDATGPEVVELEHGDQFELRIGPVAKRLGEAHVRMLAYNRSIPGPTLRVRQGAEVAIRVLNEGDLEATVHWHGLRLDNRYDGTAHTQRPIPVGGEFLYRVRFPDPGVYWYHPLIREDYGQEMGLYGNIVVVPSEAGYWPPADREIALTLDDVLLEEGRVAPFSRSESTYTAMGRFGNVLLVNGDPAFALRARRGEVLRLYLTNTANTRVFHVGIPGARLKLVGGDSGHYEREVFVERVLIAPSERAVVDVLFEQAGKLVLDHRTPSRTYALAAITVAEEGVEPFLASRFHELRAPSDMAAERARIAPFLQAPPDKTLALVAEMDMDPPASGSKVAYVCPMHMDVGSDVPGRCPRCGMKLMATEAAPASYTCPMHPEVKSEEPGRCPKCGMKLLSAEVAGKASHGEGHHGHGHAGSPAGGHAHATAADLPAGIEWEDDMVDVNRLTTPRNMRWKLVDRETGSEGRAIQWRFRVGDRVKIRLVNEMDSDHPMHHPFHVHGAGRFLILSRDGVVESNLVWKDTVLIPTGQTVDILLDVTNPGRWMAHCHIAEHHEGGMMLDFVVEP
ncbi:MAG TPA: multicopper oxidase domain-containing protein [Candidatus Polarisedimenticolaceae bacterium]|nr:multicopper oxidase domain-containing protein [Candidatus Polarisedimenticolaceae bacterium]